MKKCPRASYPLSIADENEDQKLIDRLVGEDGFEKVWLAKQETSEECSALTKAGQRETVACSANLPMLCFAESKFCMSTSRLNAYGWYLSILLKYELTLCVYIVRAHKSRGNHVIISTAQRGRAF